MTPVRLAPRFTLGFAWALVWALTLVLFGQRTNTFNLGPDAKALTVQVEVTSPQLPAPVRYSLTFVRGE